MRWIGSFILGTVLWYVLTLILGFVMGLVMGFESLDHVMKYSIYYELALYPLGIWLGFKITKTPFF